MAVDAEFSRFGALDRLPPGYRVVQRLNVESTRVLLWLNVAGLGLLIVGLVLFAHIGAWLDSQRLTSGPNPFGGVGPVLLVIIVLALFVVMLAVHELLHGLGFRLFGVRPRYGINLSKGVAYASGERAYVARDAYLVVALLPLVGITLLCIALMALTSGETRNVIGLIGAANVGGAVGDLWFVLTCLRYPRHLLVRDYGEGAELYYTANLTRRAP